MAFELVKQGEYLAKIINYGVVPGMKGFPSIQVQFQFNEGHKARTLNWRGNFAEGKPREFCMKTLATMGFTGDDITTLMRGMEGNGLDTTKEYTIVVEHSDPAKTKDGKVYANIKYVNSVSKKQAFLMGEEVRAMLDSLNGEWKAFKLDKGIEAIANNSATAPTTDAHTDNLPW